MSQEKNSHTGCLCCSSILQQYLLPSGVSMPSQANLHTFPSSHNKIAVNKQYKLCLDFADQRSSHCLKACYLIFSQGLSFRHCFSPYRSGAGGRGEIAEKGGGRMVDNFKYQPGGSLPKRIWLNNSDPADGYEGSSIVYVLITSSALLAAQLSEHWRTPCLLHV